MNTHYLAPHETYELHELLSFKTVCLTKSATMSGLIQDPELQGIFDRDVNTTKAQIESIQQFITNRGEKQ